MHITEFFKRQPYAWRVSNSFYDIYTMEAIKAHRRQFGKPAALTEYQRSRVYCATSEKTSSLCEAYDRLEPYRASSIGINIHFMATESFYQDMPKDRIRNPHTLEGMGEVMLCPDAAYLNALTDFLNTISADVEQQLGYCWKVLNVITKRTAKKREMHWHTDGLHSAIVKILIYLNGADEENGSTAYIDVQGNKQMVLGPAATWALFDANSLRHSVSPPTVDKNRRSIEVVIGPSITTDTAAKCGMDWNCHYAFMPWAYDEIDENDPLLLQFRQRADWQYNHYLNMSLKSIEAAELAKMKIVK